MAERCVLQLVNEKLGSRFEPAPLLAQYVTAKKKFYG